MNKRVALAQLSMCLQGHVPPHADWMSILDLANRGLATAQLSAALLTSSDAGSVPSDVRVFLLDVQSRNRERNRRLVVQLCDALRALNAVGIVPVLLKGIALWASRPGLELDRILTDIDLLIRPADVERSVDALKNAGFGLTTQRPGSEAHVVAELGRPSDVGLIDLHQRPSGPPGIAEIENLGDFCVPVSIDGLRALRPFSALQIFFLVLHDQLHDDDYWRGGFDLRHLVDIASLSKTPEPVDWRLLERLCSTAFVRHALETQLIAAQRFAGAAIPQRFIARDWTKLQHWRHELQFRYPRFAILLAVIGVMSELPSFLAHRSEDRAGRRRVLGPHGQRRLTTSDRLRRLRRILASPPGKI
jgi:Uncharacterised nucleotidyltransferase